MKRIILAFAVCAFLLLLYFPLFKWLLSSWLSSPYHSHGFLIPVISGFIAWRKVRNLSKESYDKGIFILLIGFGIYTCGIFFRFPFLLAISFLTLLSSLVLWFWGKEALKSLAFPLLFLLFMVPFPFVEELGRLLQSFSAFSLSSLLNLFGVPAIRFGSEIHLAKTSFSIGTPCSGMNSLISLLALGAIFLYVLKGSFYKKAVLFFSAFPIAVSCNVFRLFLLFVIAHQWSANTALGFHAFSSAVSFIVAFLLLFLLSRALKMSFKRRKELV